MPLLKDVAEDLLEAEEEMLEFHVEVVEVVLGCLSANGLFRLSDSHSNSILEWFGPQRTFPIHLLSQPFAQHRTQ